MEFSGILRRVVLVRTDVSEELSAFLRSVRRLLVTASVVPSSPFLVTLMREALSSSETSEEPHGVTSQKTPIFIIIRSFITIS
jgi:hypothetical protein